MPYSLEGVTFTCKDSQRLPDGNCPIKDGKEALKLYDMDKDPKVQLIALAAVTVGYRLVAYLLLKAVRTKWDWSWKGWDWKSFRLAGRRRAGASHRQRTARVAGMFGG